MLEHCIWARVGLLYTRVQAARIPKRRLLANISHKPSSSCTYFKCIVAVYMQCAALGPPTCIILTFNGHIKSKCCASNCSD